MEDDRNNYFCNLNTIDISQMHKQDKIVLWGNQMR